jgi:hypothetical protein
MKIFNIACYLLFYLVLSTSAYAANHYIRAGATGANNGNNWTDAWTSLPATLTRGDIYYFADGTYGGYTFDDADSGSTYIYLKKATQSAHGTDTGWDSSYGDGTATFTESLVFRSNYIDIDGIFGGGPNNWEGPFGFASVTTLPGDSAKNFYWDTSGKGNYVNLKHIHARKNPPVPSESLGGEYWRQAIVESEQGTNNLYVGYCWFHYSVRGMIKFSGAVNWTIEYNKLGENFGNSDNHSEIISETQGENVTVRYNWFYDWHSTGAIYGITVTQRYLISMDIYGNIFDGSNTNNSYWVLGLGDWHDPIVTTNCKIYNNTFIDLRDGAYIGVMYKGSGNEMKNNIFWNPGGQQRYVDMNYDPDPVYVIHDYNWYSGSNTYGESHGISGGSSDPFVNSGSKNYHLSSGIGGISLSSPYNRDMYGNVRGADGTYDRGALEYNNSGIVSLPSMNPMPPENLSIN